jgi:hypothetical protein
MKSATTATEGKTKATTKSLPSTTVTSISSNAVSDLESDSFVGRSEDQNVYEDDWIMVVLSECDSSFPPGLMFYDQRPAHFPPAIDIFLWGGLSTKIN